MARRIMNSDNKCKCLTYKEGRLVLEITGNDALGSLYVDFITGKTGYRHAHLSNELLGKAVGIKKNKKLSVVDATAGLGRDGFILACLGCEVIMLERSPEIAALLQDGLNRAMLNPELANKLSIHLINIDAQDYFAALKPEQFPDVIYLDPMHPTRTKSALVKKEMRLVREIVGEDIDADALLTTALKLARYRVVVKRPRLAPSLNNMKPDFTMEGKRQRFDVYLRR